MDGIGGFAPMIKVSHLSWKAYAKVLKEDRPIVSALVALTVANTLPLQGCLGGHEVYPFSIQVVC